MEISLTDFIDFLVSSGSPKLTKVRELKKRPEYHPNFDFWKPLRDHITEYHRNGEGDKRYLDRLLPTVADGKKRTAYPPLIKNYKRFLGKKQIIPLPPLKTEWKYKTLIVRINPELRLNIGDQVTLIKLYFKADALSKVKVDLILLLLGLTLGDKLDADARYAVHDVHHDKFYSVPRPGLELLPLLYGEAESFITMWDMLE